MEKRIELSNKTLTPIEAQLAKQGYTLGDSAQRYDNFRYHIDTLYNFAIATREQRDEMWETLKKIIIESAQKI